MTMPATLLDQGSRLRREAYIEPNAIRNMKCVTSAYTRQSGRVIFVLMSRPLRPRADKGRPMSSRASDVQNGAQKKSSKAST